MGRNDLNRVMSDVYRYTGGTGLLNLVKCFWFCHGFRVTYFMRKSRNGYFLFRWFYRIIFWHYVRKYGIQTHWRLNVGKGLYIGHFGSIIINGTVTIGDNCNINQGVTIGIENRGKRKGVPTIGNKVWFGANSVVVGNITVGNNVLIAPLTFVNFDVPSDSIVIGNPAKIISDKKATEHYIDNCVE